MSPQKLAAQVGHVCKELGKKRLDSVASEDIIVVLSASATKFEKYIKEYKDLTYCSHVQVDNGLTEVPAGTPTVIGWIEEM